MGTHVHTQTHTHMCTHTNTNACVRAKKKNTHTHTHTMATEGDDPKTITIPTQKEFHPSLIKYNLSSRLAPLLPHHLQPPALTQINHVRSAAGRFVPSSALRLDRIKERTCAVRFVLALDASSFVAVLDVDDGAFDPGIAIVSEGRFGDAFGSSRFE